jgi:hypothetical protein
VGVRVAADAGKHQQLLRCCMGVRAGASGPLRLASVFGGMCCKGLFAHASIELFYGEDC